MTNASSQNTVHAKVEGTFNWEDPLGFSALLTEEERMIADATRELLPRQINATRTGS